MDHLQARELAGKINKPQPRIDLELVEAINHLFTRALFRSKLTKISAWMRRRSTELLSLEQVQSKKMITSRRSVGTRFVELDKIRGSADRATDFDIDFNPIQDYTEQRWLNIAKAYLTDVTLPPVSLVQIGDTYFVQDGHHRISVAKALGQIDIDAEVTVWNYAKAEGESLLAQDHTEAKAKAEYCLA